MRFNARMKPTNGVAATLLAIALVACGSPQERGTAGMAVQSPAAGRGFNPLTPGFAREADGGARNGQSVRDPERPRVQRIAVLPDRTTGRDWGLPYLDAAVEDLNIVRPDAVFTVGDMVQGYTRDAARWDREATDYLARVGRLHARFYPTPGNHDVISGTRSSDDRTFAERYRRFFGPLYYSVELDLATAIVLFSDEGLGDGKIILSDAQLAWLAGTLDAAAARAKPIFLLMHRPLWRSASVKWDQRVQPLLEKAGVDAVIAGHFHALQRDPDVNGVQYHIVGTCGGMMDQPPLAGQLQHLTFVDCGADGALRVWHQPVGLVLPHDFVVRADQDRVWKLREPAAVRTAGSLPDPATLTEPRDVEVQLAVRNPTDVPIRITLEPPGLLQVPGAAPAWWTAGRDGRGTPGAPGGVNGWTSHALADVDNTHTMSTRARSAVQAEPGALAADVPPGGERTVTLKARLLPQPTDDVRAPQLDVYAVFVDTKGREVPVYLPTRLPIERTVKAAPKQSGAAAYPVLAWDYSPYDTREANPSVRVWRADLGSLGIEVSVPDDRSTGAPQWTAPDDKRKGNPHADAVRVIVSGADGTVVLDTLCEPFTAGFACADAGCTWTFGPAQAGDGWSATLVARIPPGATPASLQVGVADNDDTYHTQWRWLAPGGAKGRWAIGTQETSP